jgi:hypothetical protein
MWSQGAIDFDPLLKLAVFSGYRYVALIDQRLFRITLFVQMSYFGWKIRDYLPC